jgi:arylsulfatase A-like enzyme
VNILLVVIDSLRASALGGATPDGPSTPFLDRLREGTVHFRRAYASECWTLPAHMSMFTGLLPSQHAAHFRTMAYEAPAPTIAELLSAAGYHTEVVTRNSLFDGTVPGATRGFQVNTRLVGDLGGGLHSAAFGVFLALGKPRVRRLFRKSGFLSPLQKESRSLVTRMAQLAIPADRLVLDHALEQMGRLRRSGRPYFLFLNLYDVHAPYPPQATSFLASFRTLGGWRENVSLPWVLPRVSGHAYLRSDFRLAAGSRRMLLRRYHAAIEHMDRKLAVFHDQARTSGLLDDTLLVITSDHGEAFGDHGLYFHDASVYETHLHVPLWIHHPDVAPQAVDDIVSTRDLFTLFRSIALDGTLRGTLLDPGARARQGVALAEHFHYPHVRRMLPRYRQDIAAALVGRRKVIVRREGLEHYDLARDPDESSPVGGPIESFVAACRKDGTAAAAIDTARAHLERWAAAGS